MTAMTTPTLATALFTAAQSHAIDAQAMLVLGVDSPTLMSRAADAAFRVLRRRWPEARRIAVLCGPGNNGGDGYLLALRAREEGLASRVVAVVEPVSEEARAARDRFVKAGGDVSERLDLAGAEVLVDALLGTGLSRPPEDAVAGAIHAINAAGLPVLAVDIPSGLSADTGTTPGPCVRADATVTFIAHKRGMFTQEAADHVGVLELASLGADERVIADQPPSAILMQPQVLPRRRRQSNKGQYGHVLAIGGDHGTGGAVLMCASAALRVGAGLVSVATRVENIVALHAARPELMPHAADGPQSLEQPLAKASVLAVGPGLGQGAWGHALWLTALDAGLPMVLDADGLNLLAKQPRSFTAPTILTPHPGEAGRLLDCDTRDIQADRFAAAAAIASKYHAVVVLKGTGSIVASPDGRLQVCPWGNPGMASGGMGDILTGVIAGLLAQCPEDAFDAACLGTSVHARAGDLAARRGEIGLAATDLLDTLRTVLNGVDHA
jgi:ADP-dependent NAD(P)H-hydrate dehydratase / NAD(P)H-hydrate epimerase